jgi:hypothetical protein
VVTKITVFRDITSCSQLKVDRHLRTTYLYRLHLQGRTINRARIWRESRWQGELCCTLQQNLCLHIGANVLCVDARCIHVKQMKQVWKHSELMINQTIYVRRRRECPTVLIARSFPFCGPIPSLITFNNFAMDHHCRPILRTTLNIRKMFIDQSVVTHLVPKIVVNPRLVKINKIETTS